MKQVITIMLLLMVAVVAIGQPAPRHREEVTFDSNRKSWIVYGGVEPKLRGGQTFPTDVNEWSGSSWNKYSSSGPATGPYNIIMLYNASEKNTVFISSDTIQSVWKWDGKEWKSAGKNATALREIEACYDPHQKRVLIYGNINRPGVPEYGLWEFKANTFKKISGKTPAFSTSEFAPFEIAFDVKRKSLVLPTWENGKSVVWEWQNEQWVKTICEGDFPSYRFYFSLAYHEKEGVTYLFGGRNNTNAFLNDFWKWDGKNWSKVESKEAPSMRCATTLEYGNDELILYGGVAEWGSTNEMWQWKNGNWKLLNGEYAMDGKRKLDSLKFLLSKYPTEGNLYYEYASLTDRMTNQKSEVEQAYRKAVELNAAQPIHLFYLVDFLYKQNKPREAENYLTKALANHNSRDFYATVGRVLLRIGKYAEGIPFYEKANEMEPKAGDFYNVACAYSLVGNKDKAFENLNRAADSGYDTRSNFENDTDLESLKSDPRWKVLLEKLK